MRFTVFIFYVSQYQNSDIGLPSIGSMALSKRSLLIELIDGATFAYLGVMGSFFYLDIKGQFLFYLEANIYKRQSSQILSYKCYSSNHPGKNLPFPYNVLSSRQHPLQGFSCYAIE